MSTYTGSSDAFSTRRITVVGVTAFAAIMLMTVSLFQILQGIAAIASDKIYVTGIDYAYEFDVTTWGWIHLVVGIIALVTGFGLLVGQTWAQLTGIAIAVISCVTNFAFLPYYPFWSIAVIAFNLLVIWAIAQSLGRDA
jgi:hypothetical protein